MAAAVSVLPGEHAAPRGGDEHKRQRAGVQGGVHRARSADRWSRGAVRRQPEPQAAGPTASPPQTPDSVRNQALMRILRAPPGPAPRPPRLLLEDVCGEGGPCAEDGGLCLGGVARGLPDPGEEVEDGHGLLRGTQEGPLSRSAETQAAGWRGPRGHRLSPAPRHTRGRSALGALAGMPVMQQQRGDVGTPRGSYGRAW